MTKGRIFLLNDGELKGMREEKYEVEDVLQEQLAEHTDLLGGEQINPDNPLDWILIDREVGVPDEEESKGRWSLDHLFIDQKGTPTLVEVKRAEDTRNRRKVVAQMLDYASNATQYWNIDKLKYHFEENSGNPEKELSKFLPENTSSEDFWEDVKSNIREGDIRMIFVADNIPSELKAIIEFLDKQMKPAKVLAVEVKKYSGEGNKALVPRVKGQTEEARQRKNSSSNRKNWDWESMINHAQEELPEQHVEVIKELYDFAKNEADEIEYGEGSKNASLKAYFSEVTGDVLTFKVATGSNNFTDIEGPHVAFSRMNYAFKNKSEQIGLDEEDLEWFGENLSSIADQEIDLVEGGGLISLEKLSEGRNLEELKKAILELKDRCKK